MRSKKISCLALWPAILFGLPLAPPNAFSASPARSIAQEVDAGFGYVGGATTRGGGGNIGAVDEWTADLKYVLSPQITKNVLLRCGAEWQRSTFGVSDRAPVPSVLQQANAIIGFDYQLTDEWLLRAELRPGIYSDFKDVSWRDVNAPLLVGVAYLANADLQWFFGVRVDGRSHYPALPAAGVRWRFADNWTLNLVLPKPRLEHDLNDRLKAYLSAAIELDTFRVGDHFGDNQGRSDLNHAILDYFEARVGLGLSWRIRPSVSVEADAGYVVHRRFNFFDQDLIFRSNPAPYVQIACHFRF
jgi:hypothetical protein